MQALSIKICNTVEEAPNYNTNGEGFKTAFLERGIIVRRGTVEGHDTIDLQFKDEDGNKYVALIPARLLKSLTDLTK